MKLVWSPLALRRVEEIADYIAGDSVTAASHWIERTFRKAGQLRDNPEMGRVVPELNRPEIRELIHGNYRIVYAYTPRHVSILTVRHFKQILPIDEDGLV
jgi:plasmid stabilization system protein ParE